MAIDFQILGKPGRDNALLVQVDSGQTISRLLFDCGEGCLNDLRVSDVAAIDHLLFSHFHMDHVSGFDSFFRCNYNRDTKRNMIWGPPGTGELMHCRFRGFLWNLHHDQNAAWYTADIYPDRVDVQRFELAEAFAVSHEHDRQTTEHLIETDDYVVDAIQLDHKTTSLGYVVREKPRANIDVGQLKRMGLQPGPWLKTIKDTATDEATVDVGGRSFNRAELREQLLVESEGSTIAYLTDFMLDEGCRQTLLTCLSGCDTVVCEAQYCEEDLELAIRNYHMTTRQVAELARDANVKQLVLFHLSDRYTQEQWREMLAEVRAIYPNASFADHWEI